MSQRKQTFRTAPAKRRLIRKRVIHKVFNPVLAGTADTLDSIEEVETLVRIVGNVYFDSLIANPGQITAEIKLNPSGTALNPTIIADATLEGKDAKAILWGAQFASSDDVAGNVHQNFDIDVKGMRKLDEGDTIVLHTDASVDNGYVGNLYLTLFYKKA